jgi:lipopolysaccharide/colanic/teichoic acid biosynthesis glycosyltransferase
MGKRLFDIIVSGVALCLLSPLLLLITGLNFVLSGENPFFVQRRIGLHGRSFRLIKFRTMRSELPLDKDDFQAGQTRRITPFGKFLRKTKIDELPQLVNVLKGDMSLVGPRPEVEKWTKVYPEKWETVHLVRPGITDNASIVFRNEEAILTKAKDPEKTYRENILPKKLDMYVDYVQHRTFLGDIKIILKTIKSVWLF